MSKVEQAVENHKKFYSCSAAILGAFADDAGITQQEAKAIAAPFAGGKQGKCGAVLAAEYVLIKKFGEAGANDKIAELERRFGEMNRSVMCRELKGGLTGKPLRSCRGCVTDAAELLSDILREE